MEYIVVSEIEPDSGYGATMQLVARERKVGDVSPLAPALREASFFFFSDVCILEKHPHTRFHLFVFKNIMFRFRKYK
jgi:hypothetical protein